ncbi:endonuclease/exonuclease/phosphatase family protein [Paractinoplanes brasiliensis]|uniref:Endonuclease/exonuclease/phosphatase family protein n=1 Tax=Paractinoplanes brasiliensis TaxID=52695 RepID=A0A4R6JNE7_9ACTN|nr:endonuclease/exonuclease/phosphatase family protein [Actinoplanes brasiliensis]TDO36911.1 endonuclease/exonuclease/phosphatase family protein [Actinoplanes brasiliensis]GID30431.1 endonuclease [Actinoplanes brasiliensis]
MKLLSTALAAVLLVTAPSTVASAHNRDHDLRIATYNLSLNRPAEGLLREHLASPDVDDVYRRQARNVAEVIQRAAPDIVLLNEFDYDPEAVRLFADNFLAVPQNGAPAQRYPYRFAAPSNTGIASGFDLNNNGVVDTTAGDQAYGDDSFGFGLFPGQYGMVVYSKYPIDRHHVRTFQKFKWRDMPGNLIPADFYSPEEQAVLRLSSKSHWDVPIRVGGKTLHLLVSHPTPPTFDGPEDRNGRRNHDEIRFWADYVRGKSYFYDDQGLRGGLRPGAAFVIAGDQNADPYDGDSYDNAIRQLLSHPFVNSRTAPAADGAAEAATLQGGANLTHKGDPHLDTADFADTAPGNLRADYVLPRRGLKVTGAGVFWPVQADPLSRLSGVYDPRWSAVNGFPTSDHRLVWLDLANRR